MLKTIAQYFRDSVDKKPLYALIKIASAETGFPDYGVGIIKTWSVSKAVARRAREKEWEPERWAVIRISLERTT